MCVSVCVGLILTPVHLCRSRQPRCWLHRNESRVVEIARGLLAPASPAARGQGRQAACAHLADAFGGSRWIGTRKGTSSYRKG